VTFRIGISDERIYEPLSQQVVTSADTANKGWAPLLADVSMYGGRHWSLFHRPDERQWKLILNADAGYGTARAYWGAPGVDTDPRAARAWWQRAAARGAQSDGAEHGRRLSPAEDRQSISRHTDVDAQRFFLRARL
jgi:hypothetical protein